MGDRQMMHETDMHGYLEKFDWYDSINPKFRLETVFAGLNDKNIVQAPDLCVIEARDRK
jgi:hypothetical protein